MSNFTLIVLLAGLGFTLVVKAIVSRRNRNPRALPLPPGPKGRLLLGNIFDLPQVLPWEGYDKLCKEYGKYFSVFQVMAPVNNYFRRHNLFKGSWTRDHSARLSSSSGRSFGQKSYDIFRSSSPANDRDVSIPYNPSHRTSRWTCECNNPIHRMEFTWGLGALPYGVEWRQNRRAFHQYLNNHAVQNYHPIMNEETKLFLQRIKSNPDDVFTGLQLSVDLTNICRTAL